MGFTVRKGEELSVFESVQVEIDLNFKEEGESHALQEESVRFSRLFHSAYH